MTPPGVIVTLVSYDGAARGVMGHGCHVTPVSYDGAGVAVTLASYDTPGCHVVDADLKVIRRLCPSRERRSTIAVATALHVLSMPRHCTHVIHGVSAAYGWRGWPCSALIPEMLVGSDGTSQRLRTRRSLQLPFGPMVNFRAPQRSEIGQDSVPRLGRGCKPMNQARNHGGPGLPDRRP
eukprot:scaffold110345_cov30-Phaeocystis_antarctica.AAC.1